MPASHPGISPRTLHFAFAVFGLFAISDGLQFLMYAGGGSDSLTASNPLRMYTMLAIYLIAGAAMLLYRPASLILFVREPLLILLALYPLASAAWSPDVETTTRRAFAHALTIVFCVYLVTHFTPQRLFRACLTAFLIGGVASLVLIAAVPGMGIEQLGVNAGSWHGVYGHKAQIARVGATAVAIALLFRPETRGDRMLRGATIAVFLVLVAMSQSRAGWMMCVAAIYLAFLVQFLSSPRYTALLKVLATVALSLAAAAAIALLTSDIFAAMGRDERMSGRASIWRPLFAAIEDHPVLGIGYRAFWTPSGLNDYVTFIEHRGVIPSHGHNGYLDTAAELGGIGVVLIAVFLAIGVTRGTLRLLSRQTDPATLPAVPILVVFAINNYVATVFFEHSDIAWVMAVCAWMLIQTGGAREAAPTRVPARRAMTYMGARPAPRPASSRRRTIP
jgi:O-antigen ligase